MVRKTAPTLGDREVLIEDVGPIKHLHFAAPPGEITILRGRNGVGKTQALAVVDALTGGPSKLTGRDGTTSGTARGFGMKISIGRGGANRKSGELEVESIEDRMSIDQLVDPGLKDPVAADGKRIRTLVQLAGKTPSLSLFEHLLPEGRLVELVPEEAAQASDLVDMASRTKRALEAQARKKEDEASGLRRDAEAKLATTNGVNLNAPCDRIELQNALTAATERWSRLRQQRQSGQDAEKKRADDLVKLEEAREAVRDLQSVEDCEGKVARANDAVRLSREKVDRLKRELAEAEGHLRTFQVALQAETQILDSAKARRTTIAALEGVVSSPLPTSPTQEEVDAAFAEKVDAATAVEVGVQVRDAQQRVVQAGQITEKAEAAAEAAAELRDAARGTEDVLSQIVAEMGGAFKVNSELRLIVPGTERGEEYFSELSHGERWKLAITVAIEAFRRTDKPGLLAIRQEAWEGLDGVNRRLVAEAIEGTDLSVITAEADHSADPSSEIEAETFASAGA